MNRVSGMTYAASASTRHSLGAVPSARFSTMSATESDHRVFGASDAGDAYGLLAVFVGSVLGEKREIGQMPRIAVRVDGLRRLRDVGGELAIVTDRSDLRASLGVTGLNKVFRIGATLHDLDAAPPACLGGVHALKTRSARSCGRC